LDEVIDDKGYYNDIDMDKIVVLLNLDINEESDYVGYIENTVRKICNRLVDNEYNLNLAFAVGNVVKSIIDVSQSYEGAKQALNYSVLNKGRLVNWHFDLVKESCSYYYPLDLELKLANFVKSGEKDAVEKILLYIYEENFIKRQLSTNMIKCLIYDIQNTLLKLGDQIIFDNELLLHEIKDINIEKLFLNMTVDAVYELITSKYYDICILVNEGKKSRNIQLKESIIKYLDSNYTDPNISLSSVSREFKLNESYLSQFFRDQTGVTFSDYTEKVRINNACKLLNNTDLTINEIAFKVGYNSANVFRRAFKRVEGISPTEYKDTIFQSSLGSKREDNISI